MPQAAFQGLQLDSPNVHVLFKELVTVASIFLSVVHRGIRILDQGLCILTVIRKGADANTHCDIEVVPGNAMWRREHREHLFGGDGCVFYLIEFRKHDHKFVSTQATDRVRDADTRQQPLRHQLEQGVSHGVPEGVIDVFESIEVHKQHGEAPAVAPGGRYRLGQPVVEERSVRQVGEHVVLGQMRKLEGHRPFHAHVVEHDHRTGSLPCSVVDGGRGVCDGKFDPITPDENAVRRQVHSFPQADR